MNYSINELVSQSINDPLNQLAHLLDKSINKRWIINWSIDQLLIQY